MVKLRLTKKEGQVGVMYQRNIVTGMRKGSAAEAGGVRAGMKIVTPWDLMNLLADAPASFEVCVLPGPFDPATGAE
eukprot:gene21371-53514_t